MDITEYLKTINLGDKEVAVYLASLKLGESSIVNIRKHTDLPRTTVFHTLESLKKRGLIDIAETSRGRVYFPQPPRKISTLLKGEADQALERAESFAEIVPELNQIYSSHKFQPKVRFFVGQEIKKIFDEILSSPINELYYVGETDKVSDILGKRFILGWSKKRASRGILTKSIRVKSSEDSDFDPSRELRQARYAPDGFRSPAQIFIYHNSVAIMTSAKEDLGVVISSQEFASSMKHWFRELWKVSTSK